MVRKLPEVRTKTVPVQLAPGGARQLIGMLALPDRLTDARKPMVVGAVTIENVRGNVKILNRPELETAACECYRAIQHFNRTLATRMAAD